MKIIFNWKSLAGPFGETLNSPEFPELMITMIGYMNRRSLLNFGIEITILQAHFSGTVGLVFQCGMTACNTAFLCATGGG